MYFGSSQVIAHYSCSKIPSDTSCPLHVFSLHVLVCIYLYHFFPRTMHLFKIEAYFTCLTPCPSSWLSICYSTLASSCIAHKCGLCHLLTLVVSLHALVCLLIRCTSVLSLLVNPFF